MAQFQNTHDFIHALQETNGRVLEPFEVAEIELWRKGRDIKYLVAQPGWETVLEMLQQYPLNAIKDALTVLPGDNDRALAAHAVMYSLHSMFEHFKQDVAAAVEASKQTPSALRSGLRTDRPLESVF